MATLQASNLLSSLPSTSCSGRPRASLHAPANIRTKGISLPKLSKMVNIEDVSLRGEKKIFESTQPNTRPSGMDEDLVSKLYAIAEAAADRAEMHDIIGEQRNNWNTLLLNSTNTINLTASLMAGIAAIPIGDATPHLLAFKLSSALLFTAATGIMSLTNKIQPSQLAEEQRNATRLFRQLERSIHNNLAQRAPSKSDVEEAMERVLALDKAYPLPLLPGMLEKFPKTVEPTVWWPRLQQRRRRSQQKTSSSDRNGWSKELEEEMMDILKVLKMKDEEQYVRLGKVVLNINRTLAISGPLLAGLAAVGAGLIGSPALGQWPVLMGVVGGVLATVVNTLEHGGQVGMVFELFRNCAGFYRLLEEEIESNLQESDVERRDDGELFGMKMALQLGRSPSELKSFASNASSPCQGKQGMSEFAGKLF